MGQKNLFLMCGVPGSGKTTFVKKFIENSEEPCIHVSRDAIRFSVLKDEEPYYAHDKEIFDMFCDTINRALQTEGDVNIFADATHISEKARFRTLNRLTLGDTHLYAVSFDVSLDTCLKNNSKRSGRAYVPEFVIRELYEKYEPPTESERFLYKVISIGEEDE